MRGRCGTSEQILTRQKKLRALETPDDPTWERALHQLASVYFEELHNLVIGHSDTTDRRRGDKSVPEEISSIILSTVFNNDLRALCLNFIQSVRYLRSYLHATRQIRSNFEAESLIQLARNKGYVFVEGSITAGEHFMRAEFPAAIGRWCPNLFLFQLSTETPKWIGLTLLRVLQLLEYRSDQNVTERIIIQKLNKAFRYPQADIECAIGIAWSFGLIQSVDSIRADGRLADIVQLTKKGSFLLRAPFENPAITYFMATSARLSESLIENNKCYLNHNPSGNGPRQFVQASIKTGVTLLRHVLSANEHEMRTLSEEDRRIFKLPSLDTWIERASGYGRALAKQNEQVFNELLADLNGIAA